MPTTNEPMRQDQLGAAALTRPTAKRIGRDVRCLEEVDSTNTYLLQRAADWPDGTAVFAEYQTRGRGRFQREWQAPRRASVLMSVLLRATPTSELSGLLSMAAVVATRAAVLQTTGVDARIRWPNDLEVRGRKLAGVLVESCPIPHPAAHRAYVIGIGLNCWQQPGHFPPAMRAHATSLEIESAVAVDRSAVASALLERLDDLLSGTTRSDHDRIQAAWRDACDDVGRSVTLQADGRTYAGTITEVTAIGDLVVAQDDGSRMRFEAAKTTRIR